VNHSGAAVHTKRRKRLRTNVPPPRRDCDATEQKETQGTHNSSDTGLRDCCLLAGSHRGMQLSDASRESSRSTEAGEGRSQHTRECVMLTDEFAWRIRWCSIDLWMRLQGNQHAAAPSAASNESRGVARISHPPAPIGALKQVSVLCMMSSGQLRFQALQCLRSSLPKRSWRDGVCDAVCLPASLLPGKPLATCGWTSVAGLL
jgi:hypothetical protein